ncbi:MAG: alpha-IPM isomerase [Alphaproteobacteria bacterium]|jgi:3-isopropylmalate/(R)-2-methylmalate dehydratase small subunit
MTDLRLEGRARILGDDVNTDYVIASHRKRDSLDPKVLSRYLLEAVDPAFAASVKPGDLLVAGKNFGCGSAMEVAATVVLGAGIPAVLARSFSRTYYRNAINNGLLPVVCETSGIAEGNILTITADRDITVRNETTGESIVAASLPPIVRRIVMAGGLVPYFREHGDFRI